MIKRGSAATLEGRDLEFLINKTISMVYEKEWGFGQLLESDKKVKSTIVDLNNGCGSGVVLGV